MAYTIKDLMPVGILFVVAAISIGFGAEVLNDLRGEFAKDDNGTLTYNQSSTVIIDNGTLSMAKVGKWLPTIALVIVAAILIGVVSSAFFMGRE